MSKKLTEREVSEIIKKGGCELVPGSYKGNKAPIYFKCNCGEQTKVSCLRVFRKGSIRCNKCRSRRRSESGKLREEYDIEKLSNLFSANGCKLLETEFLGCRQQLRHVCRCGHQAEITLDKFFAKIGRKNGFNCCNTGIHVGIKENLIIIREYFKENGCTLITEEYTSSHDKLDYICNCGRRSTIKWHNFHKGQRCWQCSIAKRSGQRHHAWKEDRDEFAIRRSFRIRCFSLLRNTLVASGRKKCARTHEMLGYSPEELRRWITSHENWPRVSDAQWSIDHIFPITAFVDYGIFDTKVVNALDNLRPVLKTENSVKHNRYDPAEFEGWLTASGIEFVRPEILRP